MPARLAAAAPVLLVLSIAARLAWTYLVPNGANFVDLHVYVGGAGALDHRGTLYDYVYADQTPDFPLPFTYPPFAAVVFYPLHLIPFGILSFAWQLGTIAALYGVVRVSQRLLPGPPGDRRIALLWTAVGIWLEPLRSNFDYGQINVLLVLAVLYAVYSTRWWLSGLLVGLAAGVKLTPAVSGLYFVGARRWGAAVFSAVVFFGTIAVSAIVVGDQTRYYFTQHRSTSRGAAASRGFSGTTRATDRWCWQASRSPRCWPRWRGARSAARPIGSAPSSSSNCSVYCCRRSRGHITGYG
jgi:alpha-1,2-mannosyltransferase